MRHKIILLMIDGFGVPKETWDDSVYGKYCNKDFVELLKKESIPIDACLGVEGIPQSATGQTSMFTGINASRILGRHYAAFPGKQLKKIISENNIFLKTKEMGLKPVFANAYLKFELEKIYQSRFCSVTSAMTYSIQKNTFNTDDLIAGKCVYHDITNWTVSKEFSVPLITPEKAADNLIRLSGDYDFTLFEYFLTDRAGHANKPDVLSKILKELSEFIVQLEKKLPEETVLVICSDHGNCEDTSVKMHTLNSVPLIVLGIEKNLKRTIKSIVNVYDLAVEILTDNIQ